MVEKFSILSILDLLGDEYVLLKKWPEFPSFLPGSDIDLLVTDRLSVSKKIQKYLLEILDGKESFLRVNEGRNHIHLDIIREDILWFRLDLVDEFDFFTQFSVQSALKIKLFLEREKIDVDGQEVYIPSPEHELLIRYFEYLEWFERRPDKIKHLDYILANSTPEQRAQLIENTHRFIRLQHAQWQGEVPPRTNSKKPRIKVIRTKVSLLWKKIKSKLSRLMI
jgi:hypothetical protein